MARILGVDHIAVAVRDVDATLKNYTEVLGAEVVARGTGMMAGSRADAAYLKLGDSIVVLDGAVDPDGFLAKFIDKRGEGLHHLGVLVDDLDAFVAEAEKRGLRIPHRESFGDQRREVLMSPRDFGGVVLQVMEWSDKDCPDDASKIARIRRFVARDPAPSPASDADRD